MNVEIDNASVKNGVVEEFAILRIDLSSKKKNNGHRHNSCRRSYTFGIVDSLRSEIECIDRKTRKIVP